LNYVDYTLVRLADETSRSALFDQAGLEQITSAAYDADAMALGPPYSAIFDELSVGVFIPCRTTAEAAWGPASGVDRREGRMTLFGLSSVPRVRVDALWRGALVAQAVSPMSRIARLNIDWSTTGGIDAEIIHDLGSLPSDPATLESERRSRLMARLAAGFQQPAALTDAAFDNWLHDLGAASAGDLIARYADQLNSGAIQIEFSAPTGAAPASRRLPLSAAVLVRDQPLDVAQLLADSKLVRDQLDDLGVQPTPDPDSIRRHAAVIIWMIPDSVFDDKNWPGGDGASSDDAARQLRRQTAGRWLAREGIGLVTTATNTP
jgi:hypothetical protein